MDKLKGMAEKAMHGGSSSSKPAQGQGAAGSDYGDKGLAAVEKKLGYSQSAETNEKITDGVRGFYEKQTGSKVPEKYSN